MAKYDSDRSGSDKAANRIKNYGGETMDGFERYAVEDIWIYERSWDIVSFYL